MKHWTLTVNGVERKLSEWGLQGVTAEQVSLGVDTLNAEAVVGDISDALFENNTLAERTLETSVQASANTRASCASTKFAATSPSSALSVCGV